MVAISQETGKNHAAFIWSVADLLRGNYKPSEYGKVILPLTVLRRLDCVLEPTKADVLSTYEKMKVAQNLDPILMNRSGEQFYTSASSHSRVCWTTRRTSPITCAATSHGSPPAPNRLESRNGPHLRRQGWVARESNPEPTD